MINGHGDDIYDYKGIRINFSSNVYNHFNHEGLYAHLRSQLRLVNNYPEAQPKSLERALSTSLGIADNQIMVTNGATEAIYLIAQTFSKVVSAIVEPTFSEYADACIMHHHKVCRITDINQINDQHQLVWICNPNNPTGKVTIIQKWEDTIRLHPSTLFIEDASYVPFTEVPTLHCDKAVGFPNLLQLHSMTKRFAIPGLRLGYLTGCSRLIDQINKNRMPWSVNQLAASAGHYLLEHQSEYTIEKERLTAECMHLRAQLGNIEGIEVLPTDTHFFLARTKKSTAYDMKQFLANKHGILIRDAANFHNLDASYFRIATQQREENNELIKNIGLWIGQQ